MTRKLSRLLLLIDFGTSKSGKDQNKGDLLYDSPW